MEAFVFCYKSVVDVQLSALHTVLGCAIELWVHVSSLYTF